MDNATMTTVTVPITDSTIIHDEGVVVGVVKFWDIEVDDGFVAAVVGVIIVQLLGTKHWEMKWRE